MTARWLALSGGVGGAKLVLGLADTLPDPRRLTVIANTGDDFEHLGLAICPDLDTLMYTLAGVASPATGWGRADETGTFMQALARLGGETWFHLGDADLATHVERTRRLAAGESLSVATRALAARFGIVAEILPMSDDPVRTVIVTGDRELAFQHYFVRERCEPPVRAIRFEGAAQAKPAPDVLARLADPDLAGIVIAPSNPLISIDPILAVPGLEAAIATAGRPVIAVSPIIGGEALKGPTAKMLRELGAEASVVGIARHYRDLVDGLVIDQVDGALASAVEALGLAVHIAPTVMRTLDDKRTLARAVVGFASTLTRRRD
ncbi:MAG: 2-phospho-L-lactate transferase [Alphaproteobacteria bacterium]|nr:2-phospho-L-lactate transferase [Alphaproteobacteria bacterium]